jgi:hypothetical protein
MTMATNDETGLFLQFTGLCGFVKHPTNNTRARVLLVNAGELPNHPGHGTHSHVRHAPVLVCPAASVPSTSDRQADLLFNNRTQAAFFLDDQELSFGGAPGQVEFEETPGTGVNCHTSQNRFSYLWTAPVTIVNEGNGAVRNACFANRTDPGGVDPAVSARVALTEGKVRAHSLAKRGPNGPVVRWHFRPLTGGNPLNHTMPLAELVEFKHPRLDTNPPGQVTLTTTLLRTPTKPAIMAVFPMGTTTRTLTLRLSGGVLRGVFVHNTPWENILGTIAFPTKPTRDPDTHFEHYYDLLQPPINPKRVPHDFDTCPEPGGPQVETPLCPPARYADHTGA